MKFGNLPANAPDTRIRFRFSRLQGAYSCSHSTQIKEFRRRAMESGLPYSGGSVPKMSFGPALAEGCASNCEYADLYLSQFASQEEAAEKMRQFDDGKYVLVSAHRIPVFFPSVESAANAVLYNIRSENTAFSQEMLNRFLSLETFVYERARESGKKQFFDVRKLLISAEVKNGGHEAEIMLSCSSGANIKPDAAAWSIFGSDIAISDIVRKDLFWKDSKGIFNTFE